MVALRQQYMVTSLPLLEILETLQGVAESLPEWPEVFRRQQGDSLTPSISRRGIFIQGLLIRKSFNMNKSNSLLT